MKRYPPERLTESLEILRESLSREPEVDFAFLMGSAAEGRPFRDLDVAFCGLDASSESLSAVLALSTRLERAVGIPIDLIPLSQASATFGHRASQGILLVHRDAHSLASWKEKVWTRHFDEGPRLAQHGREIFKAAREAV